MNEKLKHFFAPEVSKVSSRSSRKILSSYLVRVKLYPVETSVGFFNCKRPRCQICAYVNETDSFTSTGETYKINHKLDCMEKCLIYLLTCNKYRKQYVKQLILFAIGGIITDLTLVNKRMLYLACKNACANIFVIVNIVLFLMTSQ